MDCFCCGRAVTQRKRPMLLYGKRRYACKALLCRTLQQAIHRFRTAERIHAAWSFGETDSETRLERRRASMRRSYYRTKADPVRNSRRLERCCRNSKRWFLKHKPRPIPSWAYARMRSSRKLYVAIVRDLSALFFDEILSSKGLTRRSWIEIEKRRKRSERYASDPGYCEKVRLGSRRYKALKRASDPVFREKQRQYKAARDARKRAAASRRKIHSKPLDRQKIYDSSMGVCYLCGKVCDPLDFHVDHVIPVRLGGAHDYSNCRATHPLCNLRKSDKPPLLALAYSRP